MSFSASTPSSMHVLDVLASLAPRALHTNTAAAEPATSQQVGCRAVAQAGIEHWYRTGWRGAVVRLLHAYCAVQYSVCGVPVCVVTWQNRDTEGYQRKHMHQSTHAAAHELANCLRGSAYPLHLRAKLVEQWIKCSDFVYRTCVKNCPRIYVFHESSLLPDLHNISLDLVQACVTRLLCLQTSLGQVNDI